MALLFETWFKPAPQVPSMGKGLLPQLLSENIRAPRAARRSRSLSLTRIAPRPEQSGGAA
jgi:hypothetical protein